MSLMDLAINQIKADNLHRSEQAKVKTLREALEALLDDDELALHDRATLQSGRHCSTCQNVANARRVLEETQ